MKKMYFAAILMAATMGIAAFSTGCFFEGSSRNTLSHGDISEDCNCLDWPAPPGHDVRDDACYSGWSTVQDCYWDFPCSDGVDRWRLVCD